MVAGGLFLLSAVIGGANAVISQGIEAGFASTWAYRNVLVAAVTLAGLGGLALLVAVFRTMAAEPERSDLPAFALLGLLFCATGAGASAAGEDSTRVVALVMLAAGALLLTLCVVLCWLRMPRPTAGVLRLALLLFTAAVATYLVARFALASMADLAMTYAPDHILLPSLGGLVLGISVAVWTGIRHITAPRRGHLLAGVALFLFAGSTLYPRLLRFVLDKGELLQHEPTTDRVVDLITWAGVAFAVVALVMLVLTIVALALQWRHRLALVAWFAALLLAAGACLATPHFIFDPPTFLMISPIQQGPNYPVLGVSWGGVGIGVLAVILALIRYAFTFFTTVSVAGVSVGTMALVIVLSVMSGFESDLRKKILGSNAHILITKEDTKVYGPFTEYREIADRIDDIEGIVATTPYLVSEVHVATSSNHSNVIIKGIIPATVGAVTDLDDNIETPARALEKMWPLAEDGSVIGPPDDRDGPDGSDPDGTDPVAPDSPDLPDPPPPDMEVDIGDPMELGDQPAGSLDSDENLPDGAGDGSVDPPPTDLDLDFDDPVDLAGDDPDETNDTGDTGDTSDTDDTEEFSGDPFNAPDSPLDRAGLPGSPGVPGAGGTDLIDLEGILDTHFDEPYGDGPDGDRDAGSRDGLGGDRDDGLLSNDIPGDFADVATDDEEPRFRDIRISPRVATLPGVLVGKELEKQLHVYIGQEVRIVSPLSQDTPAGPIPRTRSLRVAGIFFTGMYEYDLKLIYVPIPTLQSFLDLGDEVTGIEIRIADPDDSEPVLAELRSRLPEGFRVRDWKEINRNLFSALELEKIAMFLVLGIIILVASFSIFGTLIMNVIEKAKEIALLKTLGASSSGIMKVFVAQGFFIGLVGTGIGVGLGLLVCYFGTVYGIPLDPQVYYIDRLPIHVETPSVVAVAIAGVVISVIATIYPAAVGAWMRPVEGLRYE